MLCRFFVGFPGTRWGCVSICHLALQVVTWVPQNDILAHPKLKAFLSHVGVNSMYEVLSSSSFITLVAFATIAELETSKWVSSPDCDGRSNALTLTAECCGSLVLASVTSW